MIPYILPLLIGFGFGTIPFSYLIGRAKGINLREIGSGNIGATNLGRALGLKFFLLGFILDALKGVVPILIVSSLSYEPALAGLTAILGHIFNPFFRMRGGKGVATTLGVVVILFPRAFLGALIFWLLVYLTTYLVSLASISTAVLLPVIVILLRLGSVSDRILLIIIAVSVIYAHRQNIKRLINGREPKTILWRKQ